MVQNKHYIVHEEQLLGTTLGWIEIIEYPPIFKRNRRVYFNDTILRRPQRDGGYIQKLLDNYYA